MTIILSPEDTNSTKVLTLLQQALSEGVISKLRAISHLATDLDYPLYLVGGIVRDLLLGRSILDIDLVVEGDAIALVEAIQAHFGGRVQQHRRFGTASWLTTKVIPEIDHIDFVTARTETYPQAAALPDIEPASIAQDLARRDFTINTIAICLNTDRFGDLQDPFQGHLDLDAGLIRILHDLSFIDDPTRIFRAIRFEQRFDFQIEGHTLDLLIEARHTILKLTPKRIWAELDYILAESTPEKSILRLSELGILQTLHPKLTATPWFSERSKQLRMGLKDTPWSTMQPNALHYLGLLSFPLPASAIDALSDTLNFSTKTAKFLNDIQYIKTISGKLTQMQKPSQLYDYLHRCSDDALMICWLAFDDLTLRTQVNEFSQHLRQVKPVIDGRYLIDQFALLPSPRFTEILTALRHARLNGVVTTLEEEHDLVLRLLS